MLKSKRTKKPPEKTANLEGSPKEAPALVSGTENTGEGSWGKRLTAHNS